MGFGVILVDVAGLGRRFVHIVGLMGGLHSRIKSDLCEPRDRSMHAYVGPTQTNPSTHPGDSHHRYREARSQGADENFSTGNPIALIAIVIAVLVIVGGKGFFYN